MAIFETPRYQIDTEHFETAADVDEMLSHIDEEAEDLCENCRKGYTCQDFDRTPEDYQHCIRRAEYDDLMEVIAALKPYRALLAARNVA